jgi:hypothetical protein
MNTLTLVPKEKPITVARIQAALAKLALLDFDTTILELRLQHELTLAIAREGSLRRKAANLTTIKSSKQSKIAPAGLE